MIASVPVAGMIYLTWLCLPAPVLSIAIAGIAPYLVLLIVLLARGCMGFGKPAAANWNQRTLLLSLVASLLIGVTVI